ncbi:MAG TPA: NADH:ubiquinone oxidoreductase subunit NDUFA12 [Stellaceae bacterium]|jgi:NADH:ubiquinone oxidoreductase subunit|nr:NADH:ubiquinone oxidoreductase subunit NDUFA12 [Stellaceae bacterium]
MTTLGTRLLTWLRGELMGSDAYGNRYYRLKHDNPSGRGGGRFSRERRWVIYKGEPEGSKVPPEWHAWLHHTVDEIPGAWPHYAWEKPHEPNLTGTPQAYHPPGSVLRGGHRARAAADYEPWKPE